MAEKTAMCFSELHSACSGDNFEENPFWKWWFCCNFSALSEQNRSFGGNFSWRLTNNLLYGFRNRNLGVQGNKLRIFFWEKLWFFNLLSILTKIFLVFGKKPSPRGVKSAFGESRWRLWGFFLKKKLIFCNFCTLSGKVSDFCKTFTAGLPKHQSKCPGNHFSEKV